MKIYNATLGLLKKRELDGNTACFWRAFCIATRSAESKRLWKRREFSLVLAGLANKMRN